MYRCVPDPSTAAEILLDYPTTDRVVLIGSTTINGLAYGIVLCLCASCVYFLVGNLRLSNKKPPQNHLLGSHRHTGKWVFYLVYTSVLNILETVYVGGNCQMVVSAYVDNRLSPGGPSVYLIEHQWGHTIANIVNFTHLVTLWLTDGLIVWRFVMLYRTLQRAKWVVLLPCAMYVGVIVLSSVVFGEEVVYPHTFYGPGFFAFCVLSFLLTTLTTSLISACLYIHKRNLERVLGKSSGTLYSNIIMMLVESAALYSFVSIVVMILYMCNGPGFYFMFELMMHVQIIAQFLIILAIARGTTWESRTQDALPSIHFEHRHVGEPSSTSESA